MSTPPNKNKPATSRRSPTQTTVNRARKRALDQAGSASPIFRRYKRTNAMKPSDHIAAATAASASQEEEMEEGDFNDTFPTNKNSSPDRSGPLTFDDFKKYMTIEVFTRIDDVKEDVRNTAKALNGRVDKNAAEIQDIRIAIKDIKLNRIPDRTELKNEILSEIKDQIATITLDNNGSSESVAFQRSRRSIRLDLAGKYG